MKRRPKQTGWVKGNYRATEDEWVGLRRKKGGRCRVCGSWNTTLHHLLGGTWRSDEAANLIPLCGDGTTGCHGIYTSRMTGQSLDGIRRTWEEVAAKIRATLTTTEREYVIGRVGQGGLDNRYPKAA